jgi:diguanylate cyclase (GGDEF)-like protein
MAGKLRVKADTPHIGPFDLRSFLKNKIAAVLMWPMAAAIVAAIGWTILVSELDQAQQVYEQQTLGDSAALAHSYAQALQRALELLDQVMLHVRYERELAKGALRLDDMGSKGLFPLPSLLNVTLVDRNGMPETSTAVLRRDLDFKTSELFLAQQAATADALYLGKFAPGVFHDRNMIQVSRKLNDPAGNFDGIVVVSVRPDYLSAGHDHSILGNYGFVGVVGSDGTTYVPRAGAAVGPEPSFLLSSSPGFSAARGSFQLDGHIWFSDKRDRYVGWQALTGYPLIAMVGLDKEEMLLPYWSNRALALNTAAWATVMLFGFAFLATGFSLRLAWRKHKLDTTRATYRMATEGGTEGFFIGQPIWDTNGSIVDVRLVDCNKRAAGFLRRRREEVIGKAASALYEGRSLAVLMECVREAVQTGVFEGEMEVSDESPLCLDWIHLKIVRANKDIAITMRDISDTKAHVAELERQSNEDALTKLPNRHWFQGYLPRALDRAAASRTMLAVLYLDLDRFKAVNDTMGHPAGDELLEHVAQRLKLAVRPHDCVVRLGGDEFVVIVEHVTSKTDIKHLAARILQAFQETFGLSQGVVSVGTSVGISMFPADGADAETLVKHADIALYWVKARGKGRYAFYDRKFSDALHASVEKERELREALKRSEFTVLYQPRVDASDGSVLSMEALVRWAHPSKGLLKPSDFLGLAEETGLIVELGTVVLEKTCAHIAAWQASGREAVPISLNVSHRQFINSDMVELLSRTLARHKVAPTLIQLEVKELAVMGADPDTRQALKAIQQTGIKLLVDNFGTCDLSIATLQTMAFDLLKVDCALTSKIDATEERQAFFAAVITMAHALGMRVVAEGVETETQASILRDLACDEIQGFHVSKLLGPADAERLLRVRND